MHIRTGSAWLVGRAVHAQDPVRMSIEFRNVSIRTRRTLNPVSLQDINIRLMPRDRVAFLSPRIGLDTLVNVITGAAPPDKGAVVRNSTLSWPIPSSAFLHKHQT